GRAAFQNTNRDAGILGQAAAQDGARRAAADDDIIEGISVPVPALFGHESHSVASHAHFILCWRRKSVQARQTGDRMEYVCDAPHDETWFRLTTEAEAVAESEEMRHAVEKHYR